MKNKEAFDALDKLASYLDKTRELERGCMVHIWLSEVSRGLLNGAEEVTEHHLAETIADDLSLELCKLYGLDAKAIAECSGENNDLYSVGSIIRKISERYPTGIKIIKDTKGD